MRRALFRLWIVFACLSVITVAVASSDEIRRQFRVADDVEKGRTRIKRSGVLIVPCSPPFSARGKLSSDYSEQNGRCWYDLPKFRAQHPEYEDLNDNQLLDRFGQHAGISMALAFRPWATVMRAAGTGVGVPAAGLILGWSLLWAYSRFRPVQSSAQDTNTTLTIP